MMIAVFLLLADVDASELGPKWLETSVAHFRRGNEDDGQKALDELVRVRPDLPIPADYPPLFLRLHKRTLQKARAAAKGSLGIPDGASVNGRTFPPGTTRVTEVPAGVHYVTLGKVQKKVVVADTQLDVAFGRPDPEAIMLGNSASFFATPVAVEATEPAPSPSPPVVIEKAPYRAIIAAPAQPTAVPAARASEGPPVYRQWWLWTIVGAAVVGASVGVTLWATAKVGDVHVSAQWQ